MKVLIISNGTIEDYEEIQALIKQCNMVICADGGGQHAYNMGVIPDVLIGDFDSITTTTLDYFINYNVQIFTYPCDKDETDTQLAVQYAVDNGAKEIILVGCVGTRFDHTFANISLLIWLMKRGIRGVIKNNNNEINVIDRYIELYGNIGEKVSLLAITPMITGIHTKGLKYALENENLNFDNPRGISNELIATKAEVVIRDGMLLVIKSRD